jgi:hypothetical protein
VTGDEAIARRRRIKRDYDLPMKEQHTEFIQQLLAIVQEGAASHG